MSRAVCGATADAYRAIPPIGDSIMTNERKTATPAIDAAIAGLDTGNPSLTLTFSHGPVLTIHAADISAAIAQQAMMHGLKQKLVDAAAISRDPDTGRTATIETKFAAVREVFDRILAGEWNKRRAAGEGGSGGLLYRALCRIYAGSKTPEALRTWLDGKSDAEQAALRKNPKVAAMIETIRAEKAGADGVDSDAILGELE